MKKILRKGETYIDVQYSFGDSSNNLYCSTSINFIDHKKVLELDFTKIANSRIETNSNDDLSFLVENIEELKQIQFFDKQIVERLIKNGIKQNEKLIVDFITRKKVTKQMRINFESAETFRLE